MGAGRKAKTATARRPVQTSWELTVRGGHLKAPMVVPTTTVNHKGQDVSFVAVSAVTPWLCEMVAGQCASKRLLARCGMIGQLRKLLAEEPPELPLRAAPANDMMESLLDDGEISEKEIATPKRSHIKKGASPLKDTVVKVKVPAPAVLDAAAFVDAEQAASAEPKRAAAAEAVNRSFLMLQCTDLAPRIEVDALAWLVCVLQEERIAHGIPNTKPRAENQKGDIWWDFINDLPPSYVKRIKGLQLR